MSDSLEDRITEVLRAQFPKSTKFQRDYAARCVVAALGLTEERRTNVMSSAGQTTDYKTGVTTHHSDMRYDHRYVTGWERTE